MSLAKGTSDEAAPKRMRLGTRSCAECRRRKVRCVYPEKGDAVRCQACTLHDIPCHPQQPKSGNKQPPATLDHVEENQVLKQRLDQMEDMLRQLCQGVLQTRSSAPETNQWKPPRFLADASTDTADAASEFGNTPLLTLFREATLLDRESNNPFPLLNPSHEPQDPTIQSLLSTIETLIPPQHLLLTITSETRKCWSLWPSCFHSSVRLQDMHIDTLVNFIVSTSGRQDEHLKTVKSLLWLALCIYEMPRSWTREHLQIAQPNAYIDALMRNARQLLLATVEKHDSVDAIEALQLEMKLHIDLGQPRKAWLSARQALSSGLFLGHYQPEKHGSPEKQAQHQRGKNAWRTILGMERETSLVLGLPSSVPLTPKCLVPRCDPEELQPIDLLQREMGSIAGLAAEINVEIYSGTTTPGDDKLAENYARTVALNREWEASRHLMPDEFWYAEPQPGLSLQDLYLQQSVKIRYFIIGKLLHMPYMLRGRNEPLFLASCMACLEASRQMVVAYRTLWQGVGTALVPCGLMDFQVFSAGVILVLHLMQEMTSATAITTIPIAADRDLLSTLIETLCQNAKYEKCTVAGQAAEVLGSLQAVLLQEDLATRQEIGDGLDLTLPFFGRLRVGKPVSQANSQLWAPPTVDFGVGLYSQDAFANYDMEMELNANWATGLDSDLDLYNWVTITD